MTHTEPTSDLLPGGPLTLAAQLARRLVWTYGAITGTIVGVLSLAALPARGLPKLKSLAVEALTGGLGQVALAAALLSLAAVIAVAIVIDSRLWRRRAEAAREAGELDAQPPTILALLWRFGPGAMARQGQVVVMLVAALAIFLLTRAIWPALGAAPAAPGAANLIAAAVIGLAFPSMIAERMTHAFPAAQLPEAPHLRRLLLLTTVIFAIAGVAEICRGAGLAWAGWVQRGLIVIVLLIVAELAVRALARLFLPPPDADSAKAVSESILAALITGGPRAPATLIRTHLGLDFARSWALQYLRKAAIPAVTGTLLFCWMLSGVKLLDGDQRGVYERFGAPVGVLGPGLHILAPWPFGKLRPVEYGTIHTIAIGADAAPDAQEQIGAEDTPPATMNKVWDVARPTEAEYLVASQSGGQQEFQAVNAEIRVLYRTGLTDADAWQSVYGSADQQAVVRQEAARLATRYFSSHTLDTVMGGQREQLEESLRRQLAGAVATDHAGIDIVAVLIETIHPPAGAAAAYHAVQAAEINADASVANATGHATRTAGEAQQEAQQALDAAQAKAVEKIAAATGDAYQFNADRNAYHTSPRAFLMERHNRDLEGLKGVSLTVVDARLTAAQMPLIDMRVSSPGATPASVTAPPATHEQSEGFVADQQIPATSTEGPPPAGTSEEAAADAAVVHGPH